MHPVLLSWIWNNQRPQQITVKLHQFQPSIYQTAFFLLCLYFI
jgi:hypothetical protein